MGKKYEVSVRFTKRVSKAQLANAVKQATKAKVKGFTFDNLNTFTNTEIGTVPKTRKSTKTTKKK